MSEASYFIDVGAAYGYYTLMAAKLMRNGFILAFEPGFVLYRVPEANLAVNSIDNVKPLNVALSDINGDTIIQGGRVKARRLDDPLQEEGIELNDNDLVKIDVEGMALKVLKGCEGVFKHSRPKLVIELHKGEEMVETSLKRLGYKILKPSKYFIVALRG